MSDYLSRIQQLTFGIVLMLLLHSVALPGSAQVPESLAARIVREQLPAVVTIVAVDSHNQPLALGSGFFISADGVIATNAHVVEGASKLVLRWRGQTGSADRILKFDSKIDLITLKASFSGTPAKLGNSDVAAIGQDIVVLGNPYGLEGTVSTGIVSGIREIDGVKFLQITAPISPGSSGGPVFNAQGRVIGIATATLEKGQNLNFALPINLLESLPDVNISLHEVKHVPLEPAKMQDAKYLVYARNPIEDMLSATRLRGVTVSLQNSMEDTIGAFQILVIVYGPYGAILDYNLVELKDVVVLPGLAKQVYLPGSTEGFKIWNATKQKYDAGAVEIRILNFHTIDRGETTLDKLLQKR